jgi:hypothetical protein
VLEADGVGETRKRHRSVVVVHADGIEGPVIGKPQNRLLDVVERCVSRMSGQRRQPASSSTAARTSCMCFMSVLLIPLSSETPRQLTMPCQGYVKSDRFTVPTRPWSSHIAFG